jgi:hypothetical protein
MPRSAGAGHAPNVLVSPAIYPDPNRTTDDAVLEELMDVEMDQADLEAQRTQMNGMLRLPGARSAAHNSAAHAHATTHDRERQGEIQSNLSELSRLGLLSLEHSSSPSHTTAVSLSLRHLGLGGNGSGPGWPSGAAAAAAPADDAPRHAWDNDADSPVATTEEASPPDVEAAEPLDVPPDELPSDGRTYASDVDAAGAVGARAYAPSASDLRGGGVASTASAPAAGASRVNIIKHVDGIDLHLTSNTTGCASRARGLCASRGRAASSVPRMSPCLLRRAPLHAVAVGRGRGLGTSVGMAASSAERAERAARSQLYGRLRHAGRLLGILWLRAPRRLSDQD